MKNLEQYNLTADQYEWLISASENDTENMYDLTSWDAIVIDALKNGDHLSKEMIDHLPTLAKSIENGNNEYERMLETAPVDAEGDDLIGYTYYSDGTLIEWE